MNVRFARSPLLIVVCKVDARPLAELPVALLQPGGRFVSRFDRLRQRDLFVGAQQRVASDLLQIHPDEIFTG